MEPAAIQQLFFQKIKESMPSHLSFVDDIAGLLHISNDSVYRRIRGEKSISLEEVQKLCAHYKISMDQFLNLQTDSFLFKGQVNDNTESSFDAWLTHVSQNFQLFNSFEKRHLTVLMKDIPPFVHFQVPELALFKFYFWMKSILHYDSFKGVKFDMEDARLQQYLPASNRIISLYHSVPMTEIWNVESVNSSIRQINFYHESGLIKDKATTFLLYDKLEQLVNHIELQAEYGLKFGIGSAPPANASAYRLFVNELILGDNTYLAELNGTRIIFLNHSVLYYVATSDERLTKSIVENLQNLERKSTMISTIGEKERAVFFNTIRKKIQHRKNLL